MCTPLRVLPSLCAIVRGVGDLTGSPGLSQTVAEEEVMREVKTETPESKIIKLLQAEASRYLAHLNSSKPLDEEYRMIKGRIVTLACKLLACATDATVVRDAELLEALKTLWLDAKEACGWSDEYAAKIDAAIAKAEGRSS